MIWLYCGVAAYIVVGCLFAGILDVALRADKYKMKDEHFPVIILFWPLLLMVAIGQQIAVRAMKKK